MTAATELVILMTVVIELTRAAESLDMTEMSKTKLKAQMLKVFREIERSGEPLIVTDRGKPTLKIEPLGRKRSVEEVFGHLRGKVYFVGDPDEPTAEEWEEL